MSFLTHPVAGAATWMWLYLLVTLFGAIYAEYKVHGHSREPVSTTKAAWLSAAYVALAFVQGLVIWLNMGVDAATRFYSGAVMEYVLSLDNLAVFYIILKQFNFLDKERQHLQMNILLMGVIGTFVLRGIILLSAGFIDEYTSTYYGAVFGGNLTPYIVAHLKFEPLIMAFGAFIIYTLVKGGADEEVDYTRTGIVGYLRRKGMPFDTNPNAEQFWSKAGLTTLGVAILAVTGADVMFAFDSTAVVVGIARKPFLAIAATFLAVAGLRSLYFIMVAAQNTLWALDRAIKGLLWVIGIKLVVGGLGMFELLGVSAYAEAIGSFVVVMVVIGSGVIVSLAKPRPRSQNKQGPVPVCRGRRPTQIELVRG